MDRTFGLGDLNLRRWDPGAAPHKIPLSEEDRSRVESAMEQLSQSGLDVQRVFDLFQDWQSRRTLLAKRFFGSSAVIVGAVMWVGMDLSKFSFLGVTVEDGSLTRFIMFLLAFIVVSGVFFESSRRIDRRVQRANVARVRDELVNLGPVVDQLDEMAARYDIESVDDLLYDSREGIGTMTSDIDAYDAVKFYQSHLKGAGVGLSLIERAELLAVYALALYALWSLVAIWI